MEDCIFCKIAHKHVPAAIEYEDSSFLVFPDIHPKSPVHLLLIPKRHIPSVEQLEAQDAELAGNLILLAQKIARDRGLKGYQLRINVGREGGQIIDHLHLHLMAGLPAQAG